MNVNDKITAPQVKYIRFLLSKGKIDEQIKKEIAYGFSGGRTESIGLLTKVEAIAMIDAMRRNLLSPVELREDATRKVILQIAWQLGWVKNNRVDLDRVNDFIARRGAGGLGELNEYKGDNLILLRNQFIALHKNYVRKA